MAVAVLQAQHREIEALRREIEAARDELAGTRRGGSCEARRAAGLVEVCVAVETS